MPRKLKTDITAPNSGKTLLKEIYGDTFTVKNTSMNILKNISKTINYDDINNVMELLPLIQKQMEIINKNNDVLMLIQEKLNETLES